MPALKNDKFKDYTRYAELCLNMVAVKSMLRRKIVVGGTH